MRSGSFQRALVSRTALVLFLVTLVPGCWIPLPEETAIVVEVLDGQGGPVDGVEFLLDGSETVVTGTQLNEGQVFVTLNTEGDHILQLDTATLLDPQGGVGWIPLASQISGELLPLSFGNRPFAGGSSEVLTVPVNKGEITVVTIFLADTLMSPADNQWLTDGSNPSPYRPDNNVDEFRDSPEPVFWWRQDPSLGTTVNFTFQLWEDDDADTRFPLGIIDPDQYDDAMDDGDPRYIQPDWQVPLAGIQRVEPADTVNQLILWSSQASDPSNPIDYDLYYAPTTQWEEQDWEENSFIQDIVPEGALDGAAVKFIVGAGSANDSIILKNGVDYTFALRARDGASNLDTLDTTGSISARKGTPPGSTSNLGPIENFTAVADSTEGGTIDLAFNCLPPGADLRIYAAPFSDFTARPYDTRFIRDTVVCGAYPNSYALSNLVNGVTYKVGIEPFDAAGNVGTASTVLFAAPSGSSSVDTTPPSFSLLTVTPTGNGNVDLTITGVTDASSAIRRVYWAPASFTPNGEAMMFTDLPAAGTTTVSLSDIPNGIPYNYVVRAIDAHGNSSLTAEQETLTGGDGAGPTWASDVPGFFTTFSYSTASTVWPLGAAWSYGSGAAGFVLGQDPGQGQGEYVWRVIQENPDRGVLRAAKLGAFYTYPGYYYASTEAGSLSMSSPSDNADHHSVFSFVEEAISSEDVMSSPFDSSDSTGYRQRTAAQYSASLAAGSWTTNQLTIIYNTDEDGQAVVSQEVGGGYLGIMRVVATNKQRPLPTPQPYLQGKEFLLSYYDVDDDLVTFPVPLLGGGIYFTGVLDEPDYQDPLW